MIITEGDLFKNSDFNEISPQAHKYKDIYTHTYVNEYMCLTSRAENLSTGWVPKAFMEKIDGYCRRFLWSIDGEVHGLARAAWKELCKSKDNGGLGFKLMQQFREALMGKHLENLMDKPPSLWTCCA